MFRLSIYTVAGHITAQVYERKRLPVSFRTAGEAAHAGVFYLKAHPLAVGFQVEPPELEPANDAAMTARTIYRAQAARKARQQRRKESHDQEH